MKGFELDFGWKLVGNNLPIRYFRYPFLCQTNLKSVKFTANLKQISPKKYLILDCRFIFVCKRGILLSGIRWPFCFVFCSVSTRPIFILNHVIFFNFTESKQKTKNIKETQEKQILACYSLSMYIIICFFFILEL